MLYWQFEGRVRITKVNECPGTRKYVCINVLTSGIMGNNNKSCVVVKHSLYCSLCIDLHNQQLQLGGEIKSEMTAKEQQLQKAIVKYSMYFTLLQQLR